MQATTSIRSVAALPRRVAGKLTGLQARMAISYALTTVAALLVIEVLAGVALWALLTRSPLASALGASGSRYTAKMFALAAAAQAGGPALDPRTTFAPGQPASLAAADEDLPASAAIAFVGSPSPDEQNVAFALLVGPDGRVVASSYPARYPAAAPVARLLPAQAPLIAAALAGRAGSLTIEGGGSGSAETVRNNQQQPIGAIYVQEPAPAAPNLLSGLSGPLLASAVFWLLISLPVGGLFGLITTRGLVRRVRRLADATSRFAAGDHTERVPVAGDDEVGQLERHFNQMAEQLVESAAQRDRLVEQQARREERARIDQELRTARDIQQSLLPREVPALPGWHFLPYYEPAREVGGDFYDFLRLADGRWGIVVGDATGKGVPAALVMAITRTMLRTAARGSASPGEVLERVNDLLAADIAPGMFVTCFYAVLDPASGQLRYANAGHEPPFRRRDGTAAELKATGRPLGMFPGSRYEEGGEVLAPGESLLFYTDGVVEAHNPAREMFGFPRLATLLAERADGAPLGAVILCELRSFTGAEWDQEDDVTLITIERRFAPP